MPARSGYFCSKAPAAWAATVGSDAVSATCTTVMPGDSARAFLYPSIRSSRLDCPGLVISATWPLPSNSDASFLPPLYPAWKFPVPTNATRLEPGRSASTVTTGIPAATALSTMAFNDGSKPTTTIPLGFRAMACSNMVIMDAMS